MYQDCMEVDAEGSVYFGYAYGHAPTQIQPSVSFPPGNGIWDVAVVKFTYPDWYGTGAYIATSDFQIPHDLTVLSTGLVIVTGLFSGSIYLVDQEYFSISA